MKQTLHKPQPWAPTRGEHKNASEELVARTLTHLGIDWAYEDRFLPLEEFEGITRGICPDYRIKASKHWAEQFLEVTTAKQLTHKRGRLRRAARLHGMPVTLIDNTLLEKIALDPSQLLGVLQPIG